MTCWGCTYGGRCVLVTETCHLWRWVDGELELALFAVVDREALHEQRCEARAGSPSEGVEDEKSLQPRTLVGQLPNSVQHHIHQLLPDCVVATSVVVGSVLLPRDELLGVKQPTVCPCAHLVYNR